MICRVRLLAVTECGTRALIGAASHGLGSGPASRNWPAGVLGSLEPRDAAAGRPELPGVRAVGPGGRDRRGPGPGGSRKNLGFRPCRSLRARVVPVGHAPPPAATCVAPPPATLAGSRPGSQDGHLVRIIDDAVTVSGALPAHQDLQPFRLVTTLLDPRQAPAAGLAAVYRALAS